MYKHKSINQLNFQKQTMNQDLIAAKLTQLTFSELIALKDCIEIDYQSCVADTQDQEDKDSLLIQNNEIVSLVKDQIRNKVGDFFTV